jgi:hypothetical protein
MNKKLLSFSICLMLFFLLSGLSFAGREPNYAPPSVLPNTTRQMRSPGFWLSRHPFPDLVILDEAGIARFNRKTEDELKLIDTVANMGPVYPGKELLRQLQDELEGFLKKRLFGNQGKRPGRSYYARIRGNMDLDAIGVEVPVRYAFIRQYADQRLLPTEDVLTERPFDIDFDLVQNSSLDAGTPLAVLHETKDGIWCYGISTISSGWVKKDRIVFCLQEEMRRFLDTKDFYVVASSKADIYLDSGCTQYYDTIRMGSRFPALRAIAADVPGKDSAVPETVQISIPFSDNMGKFYARQAYVRRENVHKGFLRYTLRNVIEQAFKMLNAPYGWGGLNGEQDCSAFLQQIFSTVGIILPRNSGAQGQTGILSSDFSKPEFSVQDKAEVLKEQGLPGATILQLKGHVLLYLGEVDGKMYAIHATSAYREKVLFGERVRDLKKVVVSDLSLGEGTSKGSLLHRIVRITIFH